MNQANLLFLIDSGKNSEHLKTKEKLENTNNEHCMELCPGILPRFV